MWVVMGTQMQLLHPSGAGGMTPKQPITPPPNWTLTIAATIQHLPVDK